MAGTFHRKHLCSNCPPALSVLMKNDQLLFPTFGSRRSERNQQPHKIAAVTVTAFSLMDLSVRCLVSIASICPGDAALGESNDDGGAGTARADSTLSAYPEAAERVYLSLRGSLLCRINMHLQRRFSKA